MIVLILEALIGLRATKYHFPLGWEEESWTMPSVGEDVGISASS